MRKSPRHYRQQIQDGTLEAGATMPSLRQVCEHFDVAGTTANRAYRMLKMEGLTLPKPGVGTSLQGLSATTSRPGSSLHETTGKALGGGETSQILEVGTTGADGW